MEVGALFQPVEPHGGGLCGRMMICSCKVLDPDTAARCLQLGTATKSALKHNSESHLAAGTQNLFIEGSFIFSLIQMLAGILIIYQIYFSQNML